MKAPQGAFSFCAARLDALIPTRGAPQKARAAFGRAKGFHGFELHRSIEKPQRYRLMVKWETLENHTVDFRGSENFAEWRSLVGQYFAAPPEVEHTQKVVSSVIR